MVVTEGFAGNIALKAAEGTARQIAGYIREAVNQSLLARLGFLLASGAFGQAAAASSTPRRSNGGVFLGLNGIVIKSHGGTDAEGFAAAIEIGAQRGAEQDRRQDQPGSCRLSRDARAMDDAGKVAKTGAM